MCAQVVSSEPSLRIIPGTGLSSHLSSVSQPYLLSGPDHISQVVSRLELTCYIHYVTLLGLTAWHVMTPRQQGNEVKIGQIRIILRMRVRPWLPIIIRVSIVGISASSCRHGGPLTSVEPRTLSWADHSEYRRHSISLIVLHCCHYRGWCEGSGRPSSQPRLLIQILTINCTLMVVYPFVVPNSPSRGYKVASCLLAHSFCNLIYHNDE